MAIDWLNEPFDLNSPGAVSYRRNLSPKHKCIKQLDECMLKHIPEINRITNSNFASGGSGWWLCEPGYRSYIHHDGELHNNMLIYWHAPDRSYGTTFYNSLNDDDIFHQFEFVPGTGYFMLNHVDADGNRPVQYHGTHKEVPENAWRLVSSWQFIQ